MESYGYDTDHPLDWGVSSEELRELALRRETMSNAWLPIEAAPKDGTTILVWFKQHGAMSVSWTDRDHDSTSDYAHWHVTDHKFGPYPVRGYSNGDDTHWMPLPAPPA